MKTLLHRLLTALLCLLLIDQQPALGDGDIPADVQVSRQQALDIAADFFQNMCGVSIAPYIYSGEYTAFTAPGHLLHAETDRSCWGFSLLVKGDIPFRCALTIDGFTGEVLWWSFRDAATGISCIGLLPDETHLSPEQAAGIACAAYAADFSLPPDALGSLNIHLSFGKGQFMADSGDEALRDLPVWSVIISAPDAGITTMNEYLISAMDGALLR